MRIIVTGAAGFVGRKVVAMLQPYHDVVATDLALPDAMAGIAGDLGDPVMLDSLFDRSCDAVIHLATVPGGACEADPARGWRINIEATRALAEAAMRNGCRFVYASSIAALGELGDWPQVDDATPPAPTMLYGAHKAMMETWLATLGRRGELSSTSARLPGLVARPGDGAGLKSAFLSQLFHAAAEGRAFTLPVSPGATSWLMSGRQAAWNICHAALSPGLYGTLTLPALHVRMDALVAALDRRFGHALAVDYDPDPNIERQFGRYPPLHTPAADALGFASDGSLDALVQSALEIAP